MASMNLILLQDVEDLGLAGESVHVAPGYGRNYLIPKGLAAPASAVALKQIEAQKEKIEAKRKADLEAAQALADKIAAMVIQIPMQASDDNHLFGSGHRENGCGNLCSQRCEGGASAYQNG